MSLFRIITVGALVATALGAGACGSNVEKRACMKMGGTDLLVSGAVLLQLDVYGAGVKCDGANVIAGTGAPVMSHTYQKGQAITLEVPPGPHTLVLTTYSDAAATTVLGMGCTETTLTPGAQICFALTLAPPSDLAMSIAPPDLAPAAADMVGPSGCTMNSDCADAGTALICDTVHHQCVQCTQDQNCHVGESCTGGVCTTACDPAAGIGCVAGSTCCNKQCVDTTSNAANCGGCGNACDQTNSFNATCSGSTCLYKTCRSGWVDCLTVPPDLDGCETHTDVDVDNCGGCGRDCKTTNVAARHCTLGLCDSTCNAGFANCTEPAAPTVDNGCETNAYDPGHCGTTSPAACTNVCSYSNATPLCPAGTCSMGACGSGFYDCNQMATDGCEAPGPTTGPGCCTGNTASAHGTAQTKHDDGVGDTFWDCYPLGVPGNSATYNQTLATDAAKAATSVPGTLSTGWNCPAANGATQTAVCKQSATECVCWSYTGDPGKYTDGNVYSAGYVDVNSTTKDPKNNALKECFCPSPTYPDGSFD